MQPTHTYLFMNIRKTLKTMVPAALVGLSMLTAGCRSSLYYAAERGDAQAVEHAIRVQGANPDAPLDPGNASWCGLTLMLLFHIDMVMYPATLGTWHAMWGGDPPTERLYDWATETPLQAAKRRGHQNVVETLNACQVK